MVGGSLGSEFYPIYRQSATATLPVLEYLSFCLPLWLDRKTGVRHKSERFGRLLFYTRDPCV